MASGTRKTKQDRNAPSARVVDGRLILTLPNARTPTVWRMGLDAAEAGAFQVVADPDNAGYQLVTKGTASDQQTIAGFDDREQAVAALLTAAEAMQNAGSQRPETPVPRETVAAYPTGASTRQDPGAGYMGGRGRGRAVITGAGLLLVIVLIYMIANTGPQRFAADGRSADAGGRAGDASGGQRSMSAEKFLQQRQ